MRQCAYWGLLSPAHPTIIKTLSGKYRSTRLSNLNEDLSGELDADLDLLKVAFSEISQTSSEVAIESTPSERPSSPT
ncbi:hypothetical protein D9615_009873 [Tricholomella constricta]|uniref:Uncharacterized protein n=1 Tax=Tricholomella constricta TaxID=117010 RepID=A0A8H5GX52_9AGAR|nr:hypothetical protein D9615_009873 [Tricholomella constricta]